MQNLDCLCGKASPLETYFIDVEESDFAPLASRKREGQNILNHNTEAPNHRMAADAAKLVDGGMGADDSPVADGDVPGESDAVREHAVVAELDVVGKMAVGE